MKQYDLIIIGGGQAGLSVAYFLRRSNLDYLILDNQSKPGGSWLQTWDSLKLFSPSEYSSLSGWGMPKTEQEYPSKTAFIAYLTAYENRYDFPIQRDTDVLTVIKENDLFKIETSKGIFYSKALVSATGTARKPFIPNYPDREQFIGEQIHSLHYRNTDDLKNKKVLVVGAGNSGAQILAEVSKDAFVKWVTLEEPNFLADDIDGRHLFAQANDTYFGKTDTVPSSKIALSSIVMVPSVKEARDRKVLHAVRPFKSFYKDGVVWDNGDKEPFDAIIWCTGFKANLDHLTALTVIENNQVKTIEESTRSALEPKLWLVGYGNWTGFASATIYGVGKTARQTVKEIQAYFNTELGPL